MKLNLIAPINDLGYGCAAANILTALSARHEVALFPIGQPSGSPKSAVVEAVKSSIERAKSYDPAAPSVRIWHQDAMAEHVGRGPKIGFPFFELDPLKPEEIHHANALDMLLVASEWARDVAIRSGVTVPVKVVPLGVDREIFRPKETGLEDTRWASTTVFFNVGKWEKRKGHDVLARAFNRAFGPDDDVLLRMCCHNPFLGDGNVEWERLYLGSRMGAAGKIEIVRDRLPNQDAVADFMNQCTVGVFPARAEGWNLDLLEAMSCGKQVIATDYSAHTEYCRDFNCKLIAVDDLEPAEDGVWFNGKGRWARLGPDQEDQLVAHMQSLHKLNQTGRIMTNHDGMTTAEYYSWDHTAKILAESIEEWLI